MKKISVNKLIQLCKDERECSGECLRYRRYINEGYMVHYCEQRLAELTPRLEQFRADIEKESARLTQAIAEAEGKRVSVRKISALDIVADLIYLDESLGLTKKSMKGTCVHVNHHARHFPNAYMYKPQSTWFTAEFTSGWCITNIYRFTCWNNKYHVYLSDSAKAEALNKLEWLK